MLNEPYGIDTDRIGSLEFVIIDVINVDYCEPLLVIAFVRLSRCMADYATGRTF